MEVYTASTWFGVWKIYQRVYLKPIRCRTPINHKNIILKVTFLLHLKAFSLGQKWSLIGKNYLKASKIFDKNQGNSVDIYFPYMGVSTHGHVQNIGQIPQEPFLDISSFWNIYKGNILQKFPENSIMSHMTYLVILPSVMSWRTR